VQESRKRARGEWDVSENSAQGKEAPEGKGERGGWAQKPKRSHRIRIKVQRKLLKKSLDWLGGKEKTAEVVYGCNR